MGKTEVGSIGEERFRREYGCEFLVLMKHLLTVLSYPSLEGIDPVMNMGQTRWYGKPKWH